MIKKTAILLFFLFLNALSIFGQTPSKEYIFWNYIDSMLTYHCPNLTGNSNKKNIQILNSLKNRTKISTVITKINIDSFYNNKNDLNTYSINTYAEITGRVTRVKISKAESCNCNIKDYRMRDIHIAIIPENSPVNTFPIIVEITPRTKMEKAGGIERLILDHISLKKELEGKVVTFQGWMFFDKEHFQNANNTKLNNTTKIWRQSAWEIHPVVNFVVRK
jgi:hypothetical protein